MAKVSGDPEGNFWEQNPELKFRSEFKRIQKEYSNAESSTLMWCIYFLEDPDSSMYNIPIEDRLVEVKSTYYDQFDEEDPVVKETRDLYPRVIMSKEKILYKIQSDALDNLTAHLKELQKDLNDKQNFSNFIKVMEKLGKIWEGHETVKEKYIESENKSKMVGGAQESPREKRTM